MPVYTIVGGVNGVGKSSLTGALRAVCGNLGVVVDPDRLIAQCGGDAYAGGQLAVQRLESALAAGADFTQETTLSGGYPKRLCRRARASGYSVRLFYVGLDTAEESLRRIRNRVARGGHDIPADLVRARFAHRFADVAKILPYCDEADFFDNDNGFVPAAQYRGGQLTPVGGNRPAWLQELMQAVP